MEVFELAVGDKDYLDKFFKSTNLEISELNFTNLFIWRDYYKIRYSIVNNFLCIISVMGDSPFCFFPIGDYSNNENLRCAIYSMRDYFSEMGWKFVVSRVTKHQISLMDSLGMKFDYFEDRANFDYIYSVKSLSTLTGKKYDGKRNHINKFKKNHTFEYEQISDENISDCEDIIEEWCRQRDFTKNNSLINERKANLDLLENYKHLGVKGAVIKVDGKAEAFTVGEKLNDDTVLIHVEKANASIHGLYPLVNQQFLANEWSDTEFVNREQDLGIEGLRKAKLSYNPVQFVEKYTVELC